MPSLDISRPSHRKRLTPRATPYYRRLRHGVHVGFLKRTPDEERFVLRIRLDGVYHHYRLESRDWDLALVEVEARVAELTSGVSQNLTIKDICDRHVRALDIEGRHDASTRAAGAFRLHVGGYPLARAEVATLSPVALETWRDSLLGTVGRPTINNVLMHLKSALNRAFRLGLIDSDRAWKHVAKFRGVSTPRQRVLSAPERARLRELVDGSLVESLVVALMLTGARPIELIRADVESYDAGTLTLASFKGRGRRERLFPCVGELRGLLDKLVAGRDNGEPLFVAPAGDRFYSASHAQMLLAKCLHGSELAGISLYVLRHTFATEALANGVPTSTVAKLMGTSSALLDSTYGKLVRAKTESWLEGLDL